MFFSVLRHLEDREAMTDAERLAPYQSILERFPDHVKAIGMSSIEIANLDIRLGELFGAILRIDKRAGAAIYLIPQSAIARLDMLKSLICAIYPEDTADFKHLLSLHRRALQIKNKRDRLIHDAWGTNTDGEPVRRDIKAEKPMVRVGIEELNEDIYNIRSLTTDIITTINWFEQFLPPLPRRVVEGGTPSDTEQNPDPKL
jgi:hypothetical protein